MAETTPVPPGTYVGGARSPIVWVHICPSCGGYAPLGANGYQGALGQCQGCGAHACEVHRFRAFIDSASGCDCRTEHAQRVGDLHAAEGLAKVAADERTEASRA